jgi:hypothetical protein
MESEIFVTSEGFEDEYPLKPWQESQSYDDLLEEEEQAIQSNRLRYASQDI